MPGHGQAGPPSGPGGHAFPLNLGRPGPNRERKQWPPLPEKLERLGRKRVLTAFALILFLLVSGISLMLFAAKVRALLDNRFHVSFNDIKQVAVPAMRHRVILNFEGEAEGMTTDMVLERLLADTPTTIEGELVAGRA